MSWTVVLLRRIFPETETQTHNWRLNTAPIAVMRVIPGFVWAGGSRERDQWVELILMNFIIHFNIVRR